MKFDIIEIHRAEHMLRGALCTCGHMLDEHAKAYDEYDTRFCDECTCEWYNGNIEAAWNIYDKGKGNA